MMEEKYIPKVSKRTLEITNELLTDDVDSVIVNGKKFVPDKNPYEGILNSEIELGGVVFIVESLQTNRERLDLSLTPKCECK